MPPASLKITDYSDRELLGVVKDCQDADGWADRDDIVKALALTHQHPNLCVGSRLGWLRRPDLGAVEKDPESTKPRYRLTRVGEDLLVGSLTAAEQKRLEALGLGKLILTTRAVAQRARRNGVGGFVRREWVHGTAKR